LRGKVLSHREHHLRKVLNAGDTEDTEDTRVIKFSRTPDTPHLKRQTPIIRYLLLANENYKVNKVIFPDYPNTVFTGHTYITLKAFKVSD
jgi:hypothetical protein